MNRLQQTQQLGQQIWLDNLSRSLVQSGELAERLAQGVSGVTSNPAIFQKAFASDPLYIGEIADLKAQGKTPEEIYETLAVADVRAACGVFQAAYQASNGSGGWVSLEVPPALAHNTEDTVQEALRLHQRLGCLNAMIKIPATDAGIAAFEELTAQGVSINLTLLFSRRQTLKAYRAYAEGLRRRLAAGLPVSHIRAVASFFISRIDAALDGSLPENLRGKTAIALAKAAYHDWQNYCLSDEWAQLAAADAGNRPNPVRLLWASTGVKNPSYPATLYIDNLIGKDTVNTVPDATLAAFLEHGHAVAALTGNIDEAFSHLAAIERAGINTEDWAHRLQTEGLKQFEDAFAQLLAALA